MVKKREREQQQQEALDVIQEFLLETMEALPEQVADVTRQLQSAVVSAEHHAANVESKLNAAMAALRRHEQALQYVKQVVMSLSDTATMASILPPLIKRFRQLVESGDLELGFDEVDDDGSTDG